MHHEPYPTRRPTWLHAARTSTLNLRELGLPSAGEGGDVVVQVAASVAFTINLSFFACRRAACVTLSCSEFCVSPRYLQCVCVCVRMCLLYTAKYQAV